MADLNINLSSVIHAEIAQGDFTMVSNTSQILDPLTLSYSENGKLVYYKLRVVYSQGVTNVKLLENGKNSRISASGTGYMQVELLVRDELGMTDTHLITITVG